jgi:hypothetical protein
MALAEKLYGLAPMEIWSRSESKREFQRVSDPTGDDMLGYCYFYAMDWVATWVTDVCFQKCKQMPCILLFVAFRNTSLSFMILLFGT